MRLLYLLRHAKSSWGDPGLDDLDRPLAGRGRRAAAKMGEYLLRERISPALVLCSPARRTRETLECIAPALGLDSRTEIDDGLYGAGAEELLERLRRLPPKLPTVMVIGHNPGMQALAVTLSGKGPQTERLRMKFPTGALAAFALRSGWRDLAPGEVRLTGFVVPRELE